MSHVLKLTFGFQNFIFLNPEVFWLCCASLKSFLGSHGMKKPLLTFLTVGHHLPNIIKSIIFDFGFLISS